MRILMFALMAPSVALAQAEPLPTDRPAKGVLPLSDAIYRTYRLDVPAGIGRVDLQLDATGNADLYVRQGQSMGTNWGDLAQHRSVGRTGRESIRLEGDDLCACSYYVTVVHGGGALGDRLKYTLRSQMVQGETTVDDEDIDGQYADDFRAPVSFLPNGRNYRTFVVDVPQDTERLTLELRGATGDLDLYARHGGPMPSWSAAHHVANAPTSEETLVIDREGAPRLRSGRYYVDVANPSGWTGQATLTGRFVDGYTGPEATGRLPEPSRLEDVRGEIRGDSAWSLSLDDAPRYRTYVIDVPAGSKSLMVRALGAEGDIDLYLRHGAPMEDYSVDPDHAANGVQADEQLYIDSQSSPALRPGRYYLDIARATTQDSLGTIDMEVQFDGPEPEPLPATSGPLRDIAMGERVSVDLYETGDRGARFRFNVPSGAESLDVRVLGASRDVDLFLRKGAVITSHSEDEGYDIKGVTTRLNEHLVLTTESNPPLTPGVWYMDVASLVGADERIAFDVMVAIDGEVEGDDLTFPPYFRSADLTPLEQAAQAVVQVSCENGSGSGTMLSADGYLMTNHHVIEADGVMQRDDIFVSFTTDFDEPPEQLFVAELVEADEELDLALLRITRDIYDRPLPARLDLPFLELGDPDALRHGDMLYIAGFPSVGGFESRTSLSVTRGIVSGFVNDVHGDREWIKTDARINAGNSGGTALDAAFRYVGVPSRERIADDDELGYSRPVTTIPAAWRALFESNR